ncbi:MAG: hypothetical protein EpisKO_41640 [Epibacterium sp.]
MEQTGIPVKRVMIEDANEKQLRDFVTILMGLEVKADATKDEMMNLLEVAGYHLPDIPTMQRADDAPLFSDATGAPRPRTFTHKFGGKERECVAIFINQEDKPGGEEPVPVSVNGVQLWVPRGERCVIPAEYVEVLENAEKFVYAPLSASATMAEMEQGLREPRIIKEIPFSYVA